MIGAILSPTPPELGEASPGYPVCTGSTAFLSLTGSVGKVQWQQSADGINGWENVTGGSGANTPVYTTDILSATTYYRAEVNQPTFPALYSNVTEVAVLTPPAAAGEVTGETIVCQGGGTFIYSVDEIENATSYEWTLPPDGRQAPSGARE